MGYYTANNVSGGESCIFMGSVLADVVKISEKSALLKFRFYAGTFDTEKHLWKEYIKLEFAKKETEKIIRYVKNKKNIRYFWDRSKEIVYKCKELEELSVSLVKNLNEYSDKELKKAYFDFMQKYLYAYGLGALIFIYESFISEKLIKYLSRYENPAEIIGGLTETDFKSFIIESEDLLDKIKKAKNHALKEKLIDGFKKRFFFIKTNYNMAKILDDKDIEILLAGRGKNRFKSNLKLKVTRLDEQEKILIELMKPTTIIRDTRKKVNLIGSYIMYRFLEEISRRTNVKEDILKNAFWHEIFDVFCNKNIIGKLKKRKYASMIFIDGKVVYSDKILVKDAINKHDSNILKGTPASSGKVKGIARIVQGPRDFSKFKDGFILITFNTRPDFVTIMKKAKAILTQEGGITSHAAIVSRELRKPCIVGINSLLESVKGGDLLEIDADKGSVRIVKR